MATFCYEFKPCGESLYQKAYTPIVTTTGPQIRFCTRIWLLLTIWFVGANCSFPTSQYAATVPGANCRLDLLSPRQQSSDHHRWYGLSSQNMWIQCNGTDRALFYKNNQQVVTTPTDDRIFIDGNDLAIVSVRTSDSGTYHCTTLDGACVSNTVPVLVIKEDPKLEVKTRNIHVRVGETIHMLVNVTNIADCGPFTAMWSHRDKLLIDGGRFRIWQEKSYIILKVFNASALDQGVYTLDVITEIGSPKIEMVFVSVIAPTVLPILMETTTPLVFSQQPTSSNWSHSSSTSSTSDEMAPSYVTQVSGSAHSTCNLGVIIVCLMGWLGLTTLFPAFLTGIAYLYVECTWPINGLQPTESFVRSSYDNEESEWDNLRE